MPSVRRPGLWRHSGFRTLWIGQTISVFGSQVTTLALPLTAVLTLKATPAQMGVLGAAQYAPALLVSLLAGVWIDRVRRRPILIGVDLGRALLLLVIPLTALTHLLHMEELYLIGFVGGTLTTIFTLAYTAFLPSLISREQLADGNGKLTASASLAQIAGPALAGGLVQVFTAPLALVVDAVSFLVSAGSLAVIHVHEPDAEPSAEARTIWQEIGTGLHLSLGHPVLRAIAGSAGTSNLFATVLFSVLVLYLTRQVHVTPAVLGIVFAAAGPGGLLGAWVAARTARVLGLGRTIVGAQVVLGGAGLLVPLASGPLVIAVPLLIAAQFLIGLMVPILNINQISLMQAITPDRVLGRVNASMLSITGGAMPIGALLGGTLGSTIGLRPTLIVGASGVLLSLLWTVLSPIRTLRDQSAAARYML
jgi:MFS family permease